MVDRDASWSMDDRNCSQNGEQFSTSPVKGSNFIAGNFTERGIEPVGAGTDRCVGPSILNRVVETAKLSPMRRLAFWIVLSIYSSQEVLVLFIWQEIMNWIIQGNKSIQGLLQTPAIMF